MIRLLSLLVMITLERIAGIGNGSVVLPFWSAGGRFLAGGGEGVIVRVNTS